MSLRIYSADTSLTGTGNKMRVKRYEIIVAARLSANARPRMKKIKFTLCGDTDAHISAAAITFCEQILAGCAGKILKFSEILGHYRKDEEIPVIEVNRSQYGLVGFSPAVAAGDNLEAVNVNLFIPFWNGTATALADLQAADSNGVQVGVVRWADQGQTSLEAMKCTFLRGVKIQNMLRVTDEHLVDANTEDGLGEAILGPAI